jgi:hypothetical protein
MPQRAAGTALTHRQLLHLLLAVVIWRAVVEDFSPFDVDVTTIPPPASFNASFMCRVCIGGTAGPGFWYPDDGATPAAAADVK